MTVKGAIVASAVAGLSPLQRRHFSRQGERQDQVLGHERLQGQGRL